MTELQKQMGKAKEEKQQNFSGVNLREKEHWESFANIEFGNSTKYKFNFNFINANLVPDILFKVCERLEKGEEVPYLKLSQLNLSQNPIGSKAAYRLFHWIYRDPAAPYIDHLDLSGTLIGVKGLKKLSYFVRTHLRPFDVKFISLRGIFLDTPFSIGLMGGSNDSNQTKETAILNLAASAMDDPFFQGFDFSNIVLSDDCKRQLLELESKKNKKNKKEKMRRGLPGVVKFSILFDRKKDITLKKNGEKSEEKEPVSRDTTTTFGMVHAIAPNVPLTEKQLLEGNADEFPVDENEETWEKLLRFVGNNSKCLQEFFLFNAFRGADRVRHLQKSLTLCHLCYVNMAFVGIGDWGVIYLLEGLGGSLKSLKYLGVPGNYIGQMGCLALTKKLKKFTVLSRLDVSYNPLGGNKNIHQLINAANTHSPVISLNVEGIPLKEAVRREIKKSFMNEGGKEVTLKTFLLNNIKFANRFLFFSKGEDKSKESSDKVNEILKACVDGL
jgi:hypothetical protein